MIKGSVLITGATGLIGKVLVRELQRNDIKVVALVRNRDKAIEIFGNESSEITFYVGDVTSIVPENLKVDYIIHCASQTSSKAFVTNPVETIMTNLLGTKNMLDFAKINNVKGFVFLSSMEVYGSPSTDEKIDESHYTNLNSMSVRSSYPESKRLCENLCASYYSEYGVPAMVVRLAQTFGPGVEYNDGRIFADFARCAVEGRDIILHTKGETKRSYLFTEDAAHAIITVLEKGTPGEVYNAANEKTYCSVYEMARLVAENFAVEKIKVLIQEQNPEETCYFPVHCMNLDTSKLNSLGWHAGAGLSEMYRCLIDEWSKGNK